MENTKKGPVPAKGTQPAKAKAQASAVKTAVPAKTSDFAFTKENYRLMLIGLGVIALGFLLMIGGGSDDPNKFSNDLFSFRRLTLAPILVLGGYVIEIFAIMKKPKE
jgi:hypothetical protein